MKAVVKDEIMNLCECFSVRYARTCVCTHSVKDLGETNALGLVNWGTEVAAFNCRCCEWKGGGDAAN